MAKSAELAYWINERYAMRTRRIVSEPTWKYGFSDDPHMGLVRYCNVHREDDKVTKWLAENWRPKHHRVWEIVLARMINYIPALQTCLLGLDHDVSDNPSGMGPLLHVSARLKNLRESGAKVFTSAYTISTCGQQMDKIDYVMGVVADVKSSVYAPWGEFDCRLSSAHRWLSGHNGLGSFLAARVIADLKNTKGHPLQDAPDWHTWCAPGPGSLKGLEEYFGKRVTPSTFSYHIGVCWEEVKPLVNPHIPPIHMQDFQNCLCEFSKYERVKKGGHVRNKYRPGQD